MRAERRSADCRVLLMGTEFGMPPPFNKALLFSAGQLAVVQPPAALAWQRSSMKSGCGGRALRRRRGSGTPFPPLSLGTDLGTSAAGGFPVPLGINATGTIVGELALPAGSAGESLAFRVRGGSGVLEALPDLGATRARPQMGVNDLEQVVGSSTLPGAPDTWRRRLLSAAHSTTLTTSSGSAGRSSNGIDVNAAGQVLAVGCDATGGNCRPYLLTPVEAR